MNNIGYNIKTIDKINSMQTADDVKNNLWGEGVSWDRVSNISTAIFYNPIPKIDLLLTVDKELGQTDNINNRLHMAARSGRKDVVEYFIKVRKADPKWVNSRGDDIFMEIEDEKKLANNIQKIKKLDEMKDFLIKLQEEPLEVKPVERTNIEESLGGKRRRKSRKSKKTYRKRSTRKH